MQKRFVLYLISMTCVEVLTRIWKLYLFYKKELNKFFTYATGLAVCNTCTKEKVSKTGIQTKLVQEVQELN